MDGEPEDDEAAGQSKENLAFSDFEDCTQFLDPVAFAKELVTTVVADSEGTRRSESSDTEPPKLAFRSRGSPRGDKATKRGGSEGTSPDRDNGRVQGINGILRGKDGVHRVLADNRRVHRPAGGFYHRRISLVV